MRLTEVLMAFLISAVIFTSGLMCFETCLRSAGRISRTEKQIVQVVRERIENERKKNAEKPPEFY